MTQSTADLIVMIFLEKSSIKDVKMDQLHKLKKSFSLSLLRGKEKPTHVRAIANALSTEGYIKISEEANWASLTRSATGCQESAGTRSILKDEAKDTVTS